MPELIWEGKYNDNGQIVDAPRVSLPFQTVETVNQSAQERQMALTAGNAGGNPEWRSRLIWGDKKYVLPSLLDEFAGKVDLIYIDPPFATGADFSYDTQIHPVDGENNTSLELDYEPNLIEQIAYRDTWGGGLDTYIKWMFDTLTLLRELLSEQGSIYVHCDWRTSHYTKVEMDKIFGYGNFRNEIAWHYRSGALTGAQTVYPRKHDTLLFYTKGSQWTFNTPREEEISDQMRSRWGQYLESDGRTVLYGSIKHEKSEEGRSRKRILTATGREPVDTDVAFTVQPSLVRSVWIDIPEVRNNPRYSESVGYRTQKPLALLERVINTSSNEGDLVLDCFAGSGTTATVAEKLGRRWITADMGRFAISTTRKRLLDIPNVKPFYVQNLGRYERQAWQSAELEQDYREFILTLYHAEPVNGYQWLHGAKAGRMVHIGPVDAPVAIDDVQRVVNEFGNTVGTGAGAPTTAGVDILGWDFGLEVDTEARELGQSAGVNVRLLRIPREVMDQKAVAAGDIRFFELAALSVEPKVNRRQRNVTLSLQDFAMPLDGVPEQVRAAVTHWSQWIDYWAVDWDYRNDTFNNQWQSYRTRQDPQLQRNIAHTYEGRGNYTVVVKVIDILGNDTTRRLEVEL